MKMTSTLRMVPLEQLVPYANNARVHSDEQVAQLRASLREFGFVAPLLIDAKGNILAGHGRLVAAKAEGLTKVPCVLVEHLSDTQRRAYILADNRLAEQASWDVNMVSLELQALQEAGFAIDLTGFALEDMLLVEPTDVVEDEGFDPTLPAVPLTRRGEVYQLGRHRLMCGDAASAEDVLVLMDGAKADLLLTDPPYNVGIVGQTADALRILNDDFDDDVAFGDFLVTAFACAVGVLAAGASFYIWHPDGEQGLSFRAACRDVGLKVRQCLVWVKQSATLGRQDYQWQHEPCLHGQMDLPEENDKLACLYGWKDGAAHLWCSDRKQTTVLCFDKPTRSAEHPTMKPVGLFAYQMCNSTQPDALVFDPFGGSGTTIIAAEQTGRRAYLMEIDPRYVDVAIARWEKLTGQRAVKVTA